MGLERRVPGRNDIHNSLSCVIKSRSLVFCKGARRGFQAPLFDRDFFSIFHNPIKGEKSE